MKKLILLLFLLLGSFFLYAQKNAVKLDIPTFFAKGLGLSYERILTPKSSANLTLTSIFSYPIPDVIKNELGDTKSIFNENELKGFSIIPEYRFYLGGNDSLRGIYIGGQLKYRNYEFVANTVVEVDVNDVPENVDTKFSGNYSLFGLGVQLGIQWLIADRISIDWYFLGLGVNFTITEIVTSPNEEISFETLEALSRKIQNNLNELPLIRNKAITKTEGNTIKTTIDNLLVPGFRTGITIGYVF